MRITASLPIVIAAVIFLLVPANAQANLMISELCDPYSNYLTDRFIEVYNPDPNTIDLTGWSLVAIANSVPVFTWTLSGQIIPGQALVAGCLTTVAVFPVTFGDNAWSTSNGNWNGKIGDGAKLLAPGDVLIDYVVATGTTFENSDYVRKPEILAPSTTYNPAEWTATPVTLASDASPGTHNAAPPVEGPSISSITTDPPAPRSVSGVTIYADVIDEVATITSASVLWGLTPTVLSNEIPMTVSSGDRYVATEPIPPQAEGATVYFKITATSDLPATSLSPLQSYTLPYELSIAETQGAAASSPYDGKGVVTHGIVTATYGAYFVLQDGTGPWNGIWARAAAPPAMGDSVLVQGRVVENDSAENAGNTLLVDAVVLTSIPLAPLPVPSIVSGAAAATEPYEGVLVRLESAVCTVPGLGYGEWEVNDGSGDTRVDDLGYDFIPILGTTYQVTGPATYSGGNFKIEPRDEDDVLWVGDDSSPVMNYAIAINETTVIAIFSEAVDLTTGQTSGNYTVDGTPALLAVREPSHLEQVRLTVASMIEGSHTLSANGVADLYGNVETGQVRAFTYTDNSVPTGYYASAEGLAGIALKAALHDIIKNHTVASYDYAWTAFHTSDDKPNGKVWDVYSDVPDGIPFYEYTFGIDEGGVGGMEGTGYTREHSFPRSWFGGEVSPMNSDIFILYPCDTHVNGNRGNYAYGETDSPVWTSLNGSKRGISSVPGFADIVFEPIDAYKGDLARAYFYVTTRYYTEDAAWPDGPMTNGAEFLPWAVDLLLQWHFQDPVSQKEIDRNGAIYRIQHNRNPFVDRPEFVARMFMTAGVGDSDLLPFVLGQNAPNPFAATTTIFFDLPRAEEVDLEIYDIGGRMIRNLASGVRAAGSHRIAWDGRDAAGRPVGSGVYFYGLKAGALADRKKMLLLK